MAKILIADDAAFMRMRSASLLKELGHEVLEAEDGAQAVEMFKEHSPDAVLLDITMPVMDGLQALRRLLERLPADIGVPVLIVQHMPAGFTRSLAERLNALCPLHVEEAREGARLQPGAALLAPGGWHMTLNRDGTVSLNEGPPECGVRPAVNVTMESLVATAGDRVVAAVLTGMGSDGTRGAGLIKDAGGHVIAEAESSCVVYGMSRSAVEAGFVDELLPLDQIAGAIVRRCVAPRRA